MLLEGFQPAAGPNLLPQISLVQLWVYTRPRAPGPAKTRHEITARPDDELMTWPFSLRPTMTVICVY